MSRYSVFAWPNVQTQFLTNSNITDHTQSPFYQKDLQIKCVDKDDLLSTGLLNGRRCLENFQCVSRNCDWNTGVCMGK